MQKPLILEHHITSLLSSGEFQQAADLAYASLESYPKHAELYNLAGICAIRLGSEIVAEQFFLKAIAINADSAKPHFNLALLHANFGREKEAENLYRRAIKLDSNNAEAYSHYGMLLEKQRRLDEAEQCHRTALSLDTGSATACFNLANFLVAYDQENNAAEAKSLFIDVIKAVPTHFMAWNNLGNLLFETGYTSAAHTAYSAALTYHPNVASAHVNMGNVLLYMDDLLLAKKHYDIALDLDPGISEAHQGLASIFQRQGNEDKACYHRNKGFGEKPISVLSYLGRKNPIQLLILASSLEGNIPWRLLIDRGLFQSTIIMVECLDSQLSLPSHQLIFNAIGDADICQNGLEIANRIIEKSQAPVINSPDAVLKTGRLTNAKQLANIPEVTLPRMAHIPKEDFYSGIALEKLMQDDFTFPILLRAPGFHGGNYFVRVDDPLDRSFEGLPGENLLAIEFLDSRSEDSLFRKYRVMSINGVLYPIHMAISSKWLVHYFSSDMEKNEHYRNEEAAFLNDFSDFLGQGAISTLEKISQALGLDYCGIDFGMSKDGSVLLFEANATMTIIPPTHEKQWDYKRASIESALMATKRMFVERVR